MTATHPDKPAVLLIGHGTRVAAGVEEFQGLLLQLQRALPDRLCAAGFLELARPTVREALLSLVAQDARAVTALPAMLLAAGHVKQDIPDELDAFQDEYPAVPIRYGEPLGVTPKLLQAAQERIAGCEQEFGPDYRRSDTLLMVIGRGCSDLEANGDVSKITRMLCQSMGFGWAETGYMAVTAPLIADALERSRRLGFANLLVFPLMLFNGLLIEEIHATTAAFQTRYPEIRTVVAPYLNAHPLLVDIFLERLHDAENTQTSGDENR